MHLLQGHGFVGGIFYGRNFTIFEVIGPHLTHENAVRTDVGFLLVVGDILSNFYRGNGPMDEDVFGFFSDICEGKVTTLPQNFLVGRISPSDV